MSAEMAGETDVAHAGEAADVKPAGGSDAAPPKSHPNAGNNPEGAVVEPANPADLAPETAPAPPGRERDHYSIHPDSQAAAATPPKSRSAEHSPPRDSAVPVEVESQTKESEQPLSVEDSPYRNNGSSGAAAFRRDPEPKAPLLDTRPAEQTDSAAREAGENQTVPGPPLPPSDQPEDAGLTVAEHNASLSSYEELLDDYSDLPKPKTGDICKGYVVSVSAEGVVVDIGGKTEGIVPLDDFRQEAGEAHVASGQEIEVLIRNPGALGEYALLSYRRAREIRSWDTIETAFREKQPMAARVVERVKGGLKVEVAGLPAFLPGSQSDLRPVSDLESLVGGEFPVRVLKINKRRGNIVVSRRALLEEELEALKKQTLAALAEGAVVTGKVKNVTDYGVFVDLGGVDGLIHVTDLSHGRIKGPSEILKAGDEVTAKVMKFDPQKERVSLSLRHMQPDPWEGIEQRYEEGQRVTGRVAAVSDYGAFVEIEPGVEGLIHISETTWSRRIQHPSKAFKIDDRIETVVLKLDAQSRKISLSTKRLRPDPWENLGQRYMPGTVVTGRVRNLTSYGAFVEIEEGVDGLVHASDLTWDNRFKHPKEMLKKSQQIKAVVLQADPENRRLSLGLKQLQPDAWETFFSTYLVGDVVKGCVTRNAKFGAFVELAAGVEGLCHNSEMPRNSRRKQAPPLKVGQEYRFKIIKIEEFDKKIGLSRHGVEEGDSEPRGHEAGVSAEAAEEVDAAGRRQESQT